MSGYPKFNYPAFRQAKIWLGGEGIRCVSPHEVDHHELELGVEFGSLPFGDYIAEDILDALSRGCKGLILLPGWPQSQGARLELQMALGMAWPVYYLQPRGGFAFRLIDMNKVEI